MIDFINFMYGLGHISFVEFYAYFLVLCGLPISFYFTVMLPHGDAPKKQRRGNPKIGMVRYWTDQEKQHVTFIIGGGQK